MAAEGAHIGPVIAKAASELGKQGILFQGLINTIEVICHGGQVAARELWTCCSGIKEGWRAGHKVKCREHFIKLNGTGFTVKLIQRKAHGYAHKERLWHFNAAVFNVQEITVIQGLQAEVIELQVTIRIKGSSKAYQIKFAHAGIQQLSADTLINVFSKVGAVFRLHIALQYLVTQNLFADHVHQDPCGYLAVRGVFFNQGTGGEDGRVIHLGHRYAIVQILDGFSNDWGGINCIA